MLPMSIDTSYVIAHLATIFCALTYVCESSNLFFFLLLYESLMNYDFLTMEL